MIDKQTKQFLYVSLLILGSILFVSCGGNGNQPEPDVNLRPTVGFSKIGNATRADFNGQVFVAARNVVVEVVAAESPRGNSPVVRVELTIKDASGKQILKKDITEPFKTTVDFSNGGGVYTLAAVAIDASGRRSVQATQQVTVDTQAPTTASFSLLVNGVSTTNFSQPIQISETGTVALQVAVNDTINGANASNAGNATTRVYLTIDGQVKKIGAAGVLSTILTANSSVTGDQFVKLAVGSYTVRVFAVDGAGNAAEIRIFRLNIANSDGKDTTKPVVTIAQPQNNAKVRGTVSLQIQIQEPESAIAQLIIVDNGNAVLTEKTDAKGLVIKQIDTTGLSEGSHTWRVVVINSEGLSGEAQVVVNVDNTAAVANWLEPAENAQLTGSTTVKIRATDANGIAANGVSFMLGAVTIPGTVSKVGDEYTLTFDSAALGLPDGAHTLKATIVDTFGNMTEISRQVSLSNVDTTPPTLQWVKPTEGATIRGRYSLEVNVVDQDNQGTRTAVKEVKIFAGSEEIGKATNTINDIWRFSWDTKEVVDGGYSLRAIAQDEGGNSAEAKIDINVANAVALGVSLNIDNIVPKPVHAAADTTCNAALEGQQLPCYGGIITIPVSVNDETGTASVTLIVESEALGTLPLGVATKAPYAFALNTSNYPNNDALKITARVNRAKDGQEVTSGAIKLGVFNQYPLPTITITSPSNEEELQGLVNVTMNINQPSPTSYTLDLNQDGKVDSDTSCKDSEGTGYREGMLVQFVDFTNRVIAEQYVDANMQAESSGNYSTAAPFKTIDFANDTYLIRLITVLRNKDASASEVCAGNQGTVISKDNFITLRRTIQISTKNTNKVPPALLITSPVNRTVTDIPTYGSVGYVTFTATDNTGIAYVELRVFSENDAEEANQTPSRHICAAGGSTRVTSALPFTPNADPYLPNANNYTIRVIAQDTEGNRTQQEVKVNIQRSSTSTASYRLDQVSPLVGFREDPNNPDLVTRIGIQTPVPTDTSYGLDLIDSDNTQSSNPNDPNDLTRPIFPISSRGDDPPPGSKFTHIYLGGTCGALPLAVNSSYEGFSDGQTLEGVYRYITQITHPDGSTYLSSTATVAVRK